MANLMNYLNIFIWATIIFHFGFSIANAQELNDNSSGFSSESEINKIELDYDKKFSELALKKNNLNQTKVSIIKSKNSLILLNDLPLSDEDKIKMIDEIKLSLNEAVSNDSRDLSQNLDLLDSIKANLLIGNNENVNENIEDLFTNILDLENETDRNLNSILSEEVYETNNKINDISNLISENSNLDEINFINSIIDNSKTKKEKLNSRILFVDDNLFSLIDGEKNNLINTIEFFIDIENNLSEPPEIIANKKIKQLKDEINQLNDILNNKKLELKQRNDDLAKNYRLLEELYKAPRYGEYLITKEGNLVPFNNEEDIIKNKISSLEENEQELEKTTSSLNLNIKTKDIQIKQTFAEAAELKKEISIQNTKIKRIEIENNNLINLQELTSKEINENNTTLINKYNEIDKINSAARWGEYLLSENGRLVLFSTLEKKIKNEILELENKNKELNFKRVQLNKSIALNKENILNESKNKYLEAKKNLNQRKIYKALYSIKNKLEKDLISSISVLEMAKKTGDLKIISSAQKKKLLAYSKLEVARADLAISKNKLEQKKLEFLKDQNLIKNNVSETIRENILRRYDADVKRLKLSNKKIKTKLGASINKNTLKKDEEMLLEEISEAEAELKKARSEGDLNKINQALKKRTLAKSKLQITRAEISIAQNKEKSKMLEYDRDFKISHPLLDKKEIEKIRNKYDISINKLHKNNQGIESTINEIKNTTTLNQDEQMLLEEISEVEVELKKARSEGDLNKINQALKKRTLAKSKLQITRAEISIAQNKEKSKMLEYDRDLKLSYPSLSLEERRNIHGNYSISVNQLNSEYNNLKNKIRNSINDRKLEQKKIEYDTAINQLNKAMDLGNPEDINAARKLLETINTAFETTKKEIEQIKNSQKIEQIKFQKESLTEKINDLNKKIAESKKASIEKNRNVFIKSGQVFSNEYAQVFNGPSPKEKEALLKKIKRGSSKNVNVMSNNLLILNGEKLIVIPLKDIIGQTDENLNSIITAAFDPKETLTEIRDSINKELKSKVSNDNIESSENNENNLNTTESKIANDKIQVSEFKSTVINNVKNAVKAEKEKAEAEKAADKAAKNLALAKKELEDLKSKLNKEAYEKALSALEDARKILSEKNDILIVLAAKATKEATEYASAQANVISKQIIKNNALNNLSIAEASADAKEITQKISEQYLDDISGRTAFTDALEAGATLAAAGAAADNAIRAAAANAGLSNDIITAGVNAQGVAYNQALEEGKSAQEAFDAAMDAGASVPAFEAYKTTAKNDLIVNTASLNSALDEVDAKEALLNSADNDLTIAEAEQNLQSIENTNALNAKNNANNEFNFAKENKSKAEQDVLEKKKLCSSACK